MALVDDNDIGGFSFIWKIQNFSYFLPFDYIKSPSFETDAFAGLKWNLCLNLRTYYSKKCTVYLKLSSEIYGHDVNVIVSVRETNGLFKKEMGKSSTFQMNTSSNSVTYDQLLNRGIDAYLDRDELTLRCRMWKNSSELSQSLRCYATSKMKASKMSYVWKLKNFVDSETQNISNHTTSILLITSKRLTLKLDVFQGVFCSENLIYLSIQNNYTGNLNSLACKISLLDAHDKVVYSVKGENCSKVSNGKDIWKLAILSKQKLLEHKDLFLPHGTLSLWLEFSFLPGSVFSEIEGWGCGTEENVQLNGTEPLEDTGSPSRSWANNFRRFYSDDKFNDLIVRTPNKEFSVHKAILCAQSEVFSAMFDRDMEENQTGVVEIKDLDNDTLQNLLLFIYTGTVKSLDWEMAPKLYYAADKYGITDLKNKCSNFFRDNLVISKVCDVLVLADRHQDNVLKSTTQDFIVKNVDGVMISDGWQDLMKDDCSLTSETMYFVITTLRNI